MKRALLVVLSGWLFAGCYSLDWNDNIVRVSEANGSNDHRIFRIASLTKIMLEPVMWKLEDTGKINFDAPVSVYFKDKLPPEFDQVSLRRLHDNRSGLPREFIDPLCLGDIGTALMCGSFGTNLYTDFESRSAFVHKLWDTRIRAAVRRQKRGYSNMGWVLMMMAILDELGISEEQLVEEYLIKPYGLKDTGFVIREGMQERLTKACAGFYPWCLVPGMEVDDHHEGEVTRLAGGMYSSPSDVLKIGYVILPHIERSWGLLEIHQMSNRRNIYYRSGMIYGGSGFIGFDTRSKHVAVALRNFCDNPDDEGFEFFEGMRPARAHHQLQR